MPSQWLEMRNEALRREELRKKHATPPPPVIPRFSIKEKGLIGEKRYNATIDGYVVLQSYERKKGTEYPVTVYENRQVCLVTRSLFDELNSNEPEDARKQITIAINEHFKKGSQRLNRECFE